MPSAQYTVHLGDQFLSAFARLPHRVQRRAEEMFSKLRRNPALPGLNFERIQSSRDPRIGSIRVDVNYRAVVLRAQDHRTFIMLWVDKHDDAYEWAARRCATIHPMTGTIQLVDVQEPAIVEIYDPVTISRRETQPDIFAAFSDCELLQLGACEVTLPLIRAIKEEEQLEREAPQFSEALYQGLFALACNEPYEQVLRFIGVDAGKQFDTEDFATALQTPANRARFVTVNDDPALQAIMQEPLAKWRVFLHPSQRYLVETDFDGPAQVLGGAGTGKSVAALHRAKHLASKLQEDQQLFFTTFTLTLIDDIKSKLQTLCSFDEIQRIKVQPLDAWCRQFLKQHGLQYQLSYEVSDQIGKFWEEALGKVDLAKYERRFLESEWIKVIQYDGIDSLQAYLDCPRKGRAKALNAEDRTAIWPAFVHYQTCLKTHEIWEPADMFRTARRLLEQTPHGAGFEHILVDEIQDFHPEAIRMLRAMIPETPGRKNDLFLVGDGHQNIYGHRVVLHEMGIHTQGRKHRLRLNYRTPEETRRWAVGILKGQETCDLDGGIDTTKGYTSLLSGPEPEILSCKDFDEKVRAVVEWFTRIRERSEHDIACACVKTNQQREMLHDALQKAGVEVHALTANSKDIPDSQPLRLATIHRIKGLEFDHVCILGYCEERLASYAPERQRAERCTFHVAATRARVGIRVIN